MKGILMKPDMLQATVEGRKTQTRRAEAGLREINQNPNDWELMPGHDTASLVWGFRSKELSEVGFVKPRYHAGETVYIKEAIHRLSHEWASYNLDNTPVMSWQSANRFHWRWQKDYLSPLHLPQEAARHFIFIEAVGAERLQEITPEDCRAEGITKIQCDCGECIDSTEVGTFQDLWNSINKDYPWESNLWVWRYQFRLIKGG